DGEAMQREPDYDRHDNRDERGQWQRHPGKRQEYRRHSAQHHKFALGEVHNTGGVVNESEAKSDKRVYCADRQSREGELQKFSHRIKTPRVAAPVIDSQSGEQATPPARRLFHEPASGTKVQSPFLISSMRKADRFKPR